MLRALLVFGLATSVIGAPIATDLCQAICAMRSADDATQAGGAAAHHSCHAEAPSSGPSFMTVHVCGHTDQLPGVDRPERGIAAPAIVPAVTVFASASHAASPAVAPIQFTPPPLVALSSQLRV